jgi:integrative and conjugative element protein (TIGR02256 family)
MQELVLYAADGTRVLIEQEVFEHVDIYRQLKSSDREAGGILIGEYRGKDLRILSSTMPGKLDQRSRYRFGRRSPHHQKQAYELWLSSNSIQSHIGDWHTHPQDYPTPSTLDLQEWRKKLPIRPALLAILGRKTDWYGLWDGSRIVEIINVEIVISS